MKYDLEHLRKLVHVQVDHPDENIPNIIIEALGDAKIKEAITYALAYGYQCKSDIIEEVLDILRENEMDTIEMIRIIRKKLFVYDNGAIAKRYREYCALDKAEIVFGLINKHLIDGVIVDVGCGDLLLAYKIAGRMPGATQIIGTDVLDYTIQQESDSRVEFRRQVPENNYRIDVESNSVDRVLLNWILHHVDGELIPNASSDITNLLLDIRRILKTGGKIIILEDAYSELNKPEWESGELFGKFQSLGPMQQVKYMCLSDWWATRVMRNKPEMNRPFNFHSGEEWIEFFGRFGFKKVEFRYLGNPPDKIHKNPQCLLVFEKVP